jgi:elongation factor Ts
VDKISSAVGQKITVNQFVRYERGEGLEKKDENFAQEVSKILG